MGIVQWIFYIFIFLLPTQLGKHFFVPFSFINGIRIDYLAPTLYLTDILASAIIFLQLKNSKFRISKKYIFFIILLLLNIVMSISPFITIYKFVKVLELFLIFLYIPIKINSKYLLISLTSSALLQLVLSSLQIIEGKSLQGIFYFFGERFFTLSTPGISKVIMNGVEILRPYGTFSHPNSLAGFYLLLYTFVLFDKRFNSHMLLKYVFLGISSMLVFLSFSKIAIISFLFTSIYYISQHITCKLCSIARIGFLLILSGIFISFQGDPASIDKRIQLMKDSLQIISQFPFFGTGLGAYLYAQSTFPNLYSYVFLQPVHNIFLLLLTELGIPLFGLFVYFMYPVIKNIGATKLGFMLLLIIVITGFFDHYWLTLQQNMLLLVVIFGIHYRNKHT